MYKKTVEMYAEGYELIEIAEECRLNDADQVLEDINTFKELSKVVRGTKRFTFNKDFKDIIVGRFQSGESSIYEISKELTLSTSTVSKYLKEAGIDTKKVQNKLYEVVKNWDDFDCCPTCGGERNVRYLGLHNQDEANDEKPTHSFCSSCNTEWYQEAIKDDEGEFISYETRKVIWHSVK